MGEIPVMVKAVIFDLDGTLVTAEIDFKGMLRALHNLFVSQGFPEEALPMRSTRDLLHGAFAYAHKQGMSPVEISRLRDRAYAVAAKVEWEGARKAQLAPGAIETLQELRRRRLGVAVLTNDNRLVTDYLLEKHGLRELVDIVISRDDTPRMKPATEGLQLILHHFSLSPKEALFVGDSTIDVMTAKKVGMLCIGLLSGVRTAEELREEGAIVVLNSLSELIPYMEAHNLLSQPE